MPIPSPAVSIVNHSSTLDILTILALGLPKVRFVAKWQLHKVNKTIQKSVLF